MLVELQQQDATILLPHEYRGIVDTFERGEAILKEHADGEAADALYLLSLQKGDILRGRLREIMDRRLEEERKKAAELALLAEKQRLKAAAEAAERQRRAERLRELEILKAARSITTVRDTTPQLVSSYTVRRGETLPQIAARAEVYNDSSLWPLIYRANRDQIRDPKQLWPGQVLKIRRNYSRDDLLEARRYSKR